MVRKRKKSMVIMKRMRDVRGDNLNFRRHEVVKQNTAGAASAPDKLLVSRHIRLDAVCSFRRITFVSTKHEVRRSISILNSRGRKHI
jgi:hypothetical protein